MILIVGGLIAVGLIAAIAVVFLALGENRAAATNAASQRNEQAVRTQPEQAVQEQRAEAQMADTGVPAQAEMPEVRADTDPTIGTNHLARPGRQEQQEQTGPLPATGEEQLAAGLASQYEALTRELRELHQKSNEIERRLSLLNEIATRFEQMRQVHTSEEEEQTNRNAREIDTQTDLRPTPSHTLDPYH